VVDVCIYSEYNSVRLVKNLKKFTVSVKTIHAAIACTESEQSLKSVMNMKAADSPNVF
jgi:hypothetical protein